MQTVTYFVDLSYEDQGLCYVNGSLYLPRMGQITKIDLNKGNQITGFTGTGIANKTRTDGDRNTAGFYGALSCIEGGDGYIYVADNDKDNIIQSVIRKVDSKGFVTTIISGFRRSMTTNFNNVRDIIATGDGNTIRRYNTDSTYTSYGNLLFGTGLTYDSYGNLFVSDSGRSCLYWFDLQNVQHNLAGTCGFRGYNDSSTGAANFSKPRMMVFDSYGRLFIADQSNSAIRMITW